MKSFWEGFEKRAAEGDKPGLLEASEIAGLGALAVPSWKHLAGKHMKQNAVHKMELAGLGVLAIPSAYKVGKWGFNKLRGNTTPAQQGA